jgi:ribonuclease P protein subunit RPR2
MHQRRHTSKPEKEKKIATERIEHLFDMASTIFKEKPAMSDRYVELARKIAMKYKIKIKSSLKKKFCKHCHKFLMPNKTARIRLTDGHMTYYCLSCKKFMRFPYKKKTSQKE